MPEIKKPVSNTKKPASVRQKEIGRHFHKVYENNIHIITSYHWKKIIKISKKHLTSYVGSHIIVA